MARTKSNLTGTAIFEVISLKAGEKQAKVIGAHKSATPMNKQSYAEVKARLATDKNLIFTGRPDLGYKIFKKVEGKEPILIETIACRMRDETAGKTFEGRAACYAAPDGTLKPFVKKEQESPKG